MRIGIDARLLYYEKAGISQYTLQLVRSLSSIDLESSYYLFASRKDPLEYSPNGSRNFRQHPVWTPSHHRFERWAFGLEVAPLQLQILHSPDFIPPIFGAKKRLITVHDLNFLLYPEYVSPESHRYYTDQIEWAVRVADHISADSHQTKLDLIDVLGVPSEKITTIHLAANPRYLKAQSTDAIQETLKKYKMNPGFILFVGTFSPRKNLPTLLQAHHRLIFDLKIDTPLILVGRKGWQYDKMLLQIDELNLRGHVHVLNSVTDEELARLYHSAAVLVLPSYYEGFGLPPLEAMHCGCPVIVSDRASLPEVVGEAGIILDAGDYAAWTDSIEKVLSDQELRDRMVKEGLEQASNFSWGKTASATLDLYHSLANAG